LENKEKNGFSLEENIRQRAYYEKYYEDLAEHAAMMEEIGKNDVAYEDREKMDHVGKILNDLHIEKHENYGNDQIENSNIEEQQGINQNPRLRLNNDNEYKVDDIAEENLVNIEKSQDSIDEYKDEGWADKQLVEKEKAMEEKIKTVDSDLEEKQKSNPNEIDSTTEDPYQNKDSSKEDSYDYGYGY